MQTIVAVVVVAAAACSGRPQLLTLLLLLLLLLLFLRLLLSGTCVIPEQYNTVIWHASRAHEVGKVVQGEPRCVFLFCFRFVIFLRFGHQQRSPYSVGRWPQICVVSKAVMWCGVVHPLWRTECSVRFRCRACKKLRTLVFAFILVSFRP